MRRCTNILILEEWRKKLHEEFIGFHSELSRNIECCQRKRNLSCGMRRTKRATLDPIVRLSEAANRLADLYQDVDDALASLGDNRLPLHWDIRTRIRTFQRELNTVSRLIEDSLFKTEMEQFLLKIKSIIFAIVNFIMGRCYEQLIENEAALFIKGSEHYISPLRTLPQRAENSLFFSRKIAQILEKIPEQRNQKCGSPVYPYRDKAWTGLREVSFGTYEQYRSLRP